VHLRAIKTDIVGESSVAFHSGVITSDKGHDSGKSPEVNRLVPKNRDFFFQGLLII
jgi:hypothetical protein